MSTFQTNFLPPKNAGSPMTTSVFNTTFKNFQIRHCMTLYLKGHKNYQKSKFKNCKKSVFISKVESLNLEVVAVFIPLEIKWHTVPQLKALIHSIEC